jgi:AbrB family looped-hinge helix DNA binding protein
MTTTIDPAGRLVIPKALREAAGLKPGLPLEIRLNDGRIEIEPVAAKIGFEKRGPLTVAVREGDGERLTLEMVNETLEKVRTRRV